MNKTEEVVESSIYQKFYSILKSKKITLIKKHELYTLIINYRINGNGFASTLKQSLLEYGLLENDAEAIIHMIKYNRFNMRDAYNIESKMIEKGFIERHGPSLFKIL